MATVVQPQVVQRRRREGASFGQGLAALGQGLSDVFEKRKQDKLKQIVAEALEGGSDNLETLNADLFAAGADPEFITKINATVSQARAKKEDTNKAKALALALKPDAPPQQLEAMASNLGSEALLELIKTKDKLLSSAAQRDVAGRSQNLAEEIQTGNLGLRGEELAAKIASDQKNLQLRRDSLNAENALRGRGLDQDADRIEIAALDLERKVASDVAQEEIQRAQQRLTAELAKATNALAGRRIDVVESEGAAGREAREGIAARGEAGATERAGLAVTGAAQRTAAQIRSRETIAGVGFELDVAKQEEVIRANKAKEAIQRDANDIKASEVETRKQANEIKEKQGLRPNFTAFTDDDGNKWVTVVATDGSVISQHKLGKTNEQVGGNLDRYKTAVFTRAANPGVITGVPSVDVMTEEQVKAAKDGLDRPDLLNTLLQGGDLEAAKAVGAGRVLGGMTPKEIAAFTKAVPNMTQEEIEILRPDFVRTLPAETRNAIAIRIRKLAGILAGGGIP